MYVLDVAATETAAWSIASAIAISHVHASAQHSSRRACRPNTRRFACAGQIPDVLHCAIHTMVKLCVSRLANDSETFCVDSLNKWSAHRTCSLPCSLGKHGSGDIQIEMGLSQSGAFSFPVSLAARIERIDVTASV